MILSLFNRLVRARDQRDRGEGDPNAGRATRKWVGGGLEPSRPDPAYHRLLKDSARSLASASVEPNDRHCRLLRAESARHRQCAAYEHQLAPVHSMTSSAPASKDRGTVSPSVFAVFRFMTNSSFVGCSTGKSPGFAPLNILSIKPAAR
jgi:hypothetical protein